MTSTMAAASTSVEADVRPDMCSVHAHSDERAVPRRKRIAWDHCSSVDLTELPRSDFHEEKFSCTEDT